MIATEEMGEDIVQMGLWLLDLSCVESLWCYYCYRFRDVVMLECES